MESAGFDALFPAEKLAVHGYAEALRHYREISGIRKALLKRLLRDRPDVFIGVDAPDFNLWLERKLKRAGIRVIHYVSPSIWAWRGGRIRKIGQAVDRILALFPFEPEIYQRAGIPVTYVGHPLADTIARDSDQCAYRALLELPKDQLVFALLPGSRRSELRHMADLVIDTAALLHQRFPDALFLVPLATAETRDMFQQALARSEERTSLPIRVLYGHAQQAMAASDASLVTSGTATLEAALVKAPHVIAYRMANLSWQLMKRMGYLPWVGLPNILSRRFVVPEFLQDDATAENIAQALGNLVEDKVVCGRLRARFDHIHETLQQNTAEKAAEAVLRLLPPGACHAHQG